MSDKEENKITVVMYKNEMVDFVSSQRLHPSLHSFYGDLRANNEKSREFEWNAPSLYELNPKELHHIYKKNRYHWFKHLSEEFLASNMQEDYLELKNN
jgi:hypothetical protein